MERLSLVVINDVVDELKTAALRSQANPRFQECVTVVRACMELLPLYPTNSDYREKMLQALTELARITSDNHEFIIAARVRALLARLGSSFRPSGANLGRIAQISS